MKTPVILSLVIGMFLSLSSESYAESDDNHFELMARNFYFYRGFQKGEKNASGANAFVPVDQRSSYRSEWAQGLVLKYDSGFTDGKLQFGFDAFGLMGIKLYSDKYKTGNNILEINQQGEASDAYGHMGSALKVKYGDTVLTYGNQFPNVPVIATSTVRLLPSVTTGISLQNKSIDHLTVNAGHFYAMVPVDSIHQLNYFTTDYGVGIKAKSTTFLGGNYQLPNGNISLYASDLEDVWKQYYLGGDYKFVFNDPDQKILLNFANYMNKATGKKLGGEIDAKAISALLGYQYKNHKFSVGYQQIFGDEPIDWIGYSTMGGNVSLLNAAQYATFSEAHEKSYQLKYETDFRQFGLPGLSFMGRYLYGWDMDNSQSHNAFYLKRHTYDPSIDNKHWETDLTLAYKVQQGFAKGFDIKFRQAIHRASAGYRYLDINELRIIMEYAFHF